MRKGVQLWCVLLLVSGPVPFSASARPVNLRTPPLSPEVATGLVHHPPRHLPIEGAHLPVGFPLPFSTGPNLEQREHTFHQPPLFFPCENKVLLVLLLLRGT